MNSLLYSPGGRCELELFFFPVSSFVAPCRRRGKEQKSLFGMVVASKCGTIICFSETIAYLESTCLYTSWRSIIFVFGKGKNMNGGSNLHQHLFLFFLPLFCTLPPFPSPPDFLHTPFSHISLTTLTPFSLPAFFHVF